MLYNKKYKGAQVSNPEVFLEDFKSIYRYDEGLYELADRAQRTLEFDFYEEPVRSLLAGLGNVACTAYRSPIMRRSVDPEATQSVHPGKDLIPTGFLGRIEFRKCEDGTRPINQRTTEVFSIFMQLEAAHRRLSQNDDFAVALMLEVSSTGDRGLALAQSKPGSNRLEPRRLSSANERQAVRARAMLRLNELVIGHPYEDEQGGGSQDNNRRYSPHD